MKVQRWVGRACCSKRICQRVVPIASILVVLAGCAAKPLEVGSITRIKPHTGGSDLDVYAAKRQSDPASAPEFAGDQLVEVRTYREDPEKGQVEMAGATCSLSAALYSADLTTPAKVRVPLYRGKSSQLSAKCAKPGFTDKLVTVGAFDATRNQRYQSASGGGLAGVAVVAVFDALSDNTKNDWRYPPVKVVMSPEPPPVKTSQR
ncbi:MAG: hypothetical protein AAFO75_04005 [Pseudomonadota bacterium]